MATKRTDISSETQASGGNPAAKSIKQKTMDEVLPKTNPDIPLRPASNNDPNKPIDAKEMNAIAAANSNHGIKNPPASPYGRGITEPATPGAVDPNSQAYAAQQQAAYAAGMQRAAAGKLTTDERLLMRGIDSRSPLPVASTVPTQATGSTATGATTTSARTTAPTATGGSEATREGFNKYAQNLLGPEKYKVFMSMPEAQRNALYSKYVERQTKNAPLATTQAAAPSGSRFPAGTLPAGGSPIPTSRPSSAGTGTAETMLRTLRDETASPEARAQAGTYLRVRTMYAQKGKYGKEIKALEGLERAKIKELGNMFKNRQNIHDPRFARQYAQYQALRKKDPQARLALYTELMKGPEFAHLDFRK